MDDYTRLVVDGLRLLLDQVLSELTQKTRDQELVRLRAEQILELIDDLVLMRRMLLSMSKDRTCRDAVDANSKAIESHQHHGQAPD